MHQNHIKSWFDKNSSLPWPCRICARAQGKSPGGDIFIHGTPDQYVGEPDWTWGCIAVTNAEIEEIYAMIDDGTKIFIYP